MAEGRRTRSSSGPSRSSRAPSPPIEQENPFIGMEVLPSVIVRRQSGRQVKCRRQMVQSMYSSPTCPPLLLTTLDCNLCKSLETGWILICVEIVKVAGRILSFNVNNILVRFPNCIVH